MSKLSYLPASTPRRHPDSAFRAVGDEGGLVVLAGRAEVKVLNPVGIRIFGLLDGNHAVSAIADTVCEEFEIAPAQALADVQDFLGELADHGMLADSPQGVER